MKKLILIMACYAGFVLNIQAASVSKMNIFTGNSGGVVTVQKNITDQVDREGRASKGLATLSDVRPHIFRTTEGASEEPTLDDERSLIADEEASTDNIPYTRISGRVRFHGEHIFDVSKQLTLSGSFRTIYPERRILKLQDIIAEVIGNEVHISGNVFVNEEEFEINAAPESVQRFVRRLIWLIRSS